MNYVDFVSRVAEALGTDQSDSDFITLIPATIEAGEQRTYRDMNLLDTVVCDTTGTLTSNSRNFTLPQSLGRFVTVTNINVITGGSVSTGTRTTLQPMWRNLFDFLFPSNVAGTPPSVPSAFAMISDQSILVGPSPDTGYTVEVYGTIRPAPLSPTNQTTYLSQYLPDLFFAASMRFASEYQQQQGKPPTSQTPSPPTAWEDQYQKLIPLANAEELRKRFNQDLEALARK